MFVFLVIVVIIAPQIYFRFNQGYHGVDVHKTDAEAHYLARVQEVKDGYFKLGSVYTKDRKDQPYLEPPLSPILAGFIPKVFNLNSPDTALFVRFLFPFLTFLALYFFLFFFTKSRLIALTASIFVFLGHSLTSRYGLFQLLKLQSPRTDFFLIV